MPDLPLRAILLKCMTHYGLQNIKLASHLLLDNGDFDDVEELADSLQHAADPDLHLVFSDSTDDLVPGDFFHRQHEFALRCIDLIQSMRVLFPKEKVPKLSQLGLVLESYRTSHPKRFQRNLRVQSETFDALVTKIEDDPIFHSNSYKQQLPVKFQLAITLYRFGHFGNAASVEGIAQWAGCSVGLVVSCTRRVIMALTRLHDEAFRILPTHIADAKAFVARVCYAWRHGWCMADGTLIPLSDKPGYHGEAYFDCKSNYSLNIMVCATI
jgi:hypothetical protein